MAAEGEDVVETVSDVEDDDAAAGDDKMSAEEKARVAAEARRKRIQEKANKRLAKVSGEQTLAEEDKKESEEKAARIRAARARRYGKKSTTATTATPSASAAPSPDQAEATETVTVPPATTESTPTKADSKPADDAEDATPSAAKNTESADPVTDQNDAATTTSTAPTTKTATPSSTAKKYQGVAKMRRKMIAQKKAEEAKEDDVAGPASMLAKKKKMSVIPIAMHILTVVLLFVAGLDVGIQQFADGDDGLQIHTRTAIQEYGIPFVQRSPFDPLTPLQDRAVDSKRILEEEYLSGSSDHVSNSVNEFHEDDGSDEEKIPNIDPLFQVDLDEYTKGPGIFNQLARGAVSIHRMVLWLLYYTPMAFARRVLSVPFALWQSPPSLFITALVLRQFVGNIVLGARLPDPSEHEDAGEKSNIDVLNMAKNFVKNFFVTSFPTLVTLYEAFTHVRTDMYIALCGVFVGIAWTHLQVASKISPSLSSDSSSFGGNVLVTETSTGATSGDEL